MSLQIAQIKDEFKAAKITELSFVITKHIEDHREGVQALIQSANKKIYAFEQEKIRTEKLWKFESWFLFSTIEKSKGNWKNCLTSISIRV